MKEAASYGPSEKLSEDWTVAIREISKHGNVILNTTFHEMNAAGIEIGDIITVSAAGRAFDLPVGTSYTDVDSGEMICRFDLEDEEVGLAINYGSFAETAGIAEKHAVEEDPGYRWDLQCDEVVLSVKEKKGYLDEYNARNLTRTNERGDYPALSDAEFANFRAVTASGLKKDTLYRSSTPVDPAIGRSEYAMAAMEQAGVRSVINLDDSAETMRSYPDFPGSYYSRCAILNPEMGYDYESDEFAAKIRKCALFITETEGPWLIHCKEGKDRAGILCAILECFAGASADDVARDYMTTYYNYYGVRPQDAVYGIILNNDLYKTLTSLFKIDDMQTADLKQAAENYLASAGLTEDQLDMLRNKLVKP